MQGCAGVPCVEQGMFGACSLSTSQDQTVLEVPTGHLFVLIFQTGNSITYMHAGSTFAKKRLSTDRTTLCA